MSKDKEIRETFLKLNDNDKNVFINMFVFSDNPNEFQRLNEDDFSKAFSKLNNKERDNCINWFTKHLFGNREYLYDYAEDENNQPLSFSGFEAYGLNCVNQILSNSNFNVGTHAFSNFLFSDLSDSNLCDVNFSESIFIKANLTNADLRFSNLYKTNFSKANLTGAKLFGTERTHWEIDGVVCEYAYWDEEGKVPTFYAHGEFERLYKEYPQFKIHYKADDYTLTQHTLLPFIIAKMNENFEGNEIVLRKIEEAPNGSTATIEIRNLHNFNQNEIEQITRDVVNQLKQLEKTKYALPNNADSQRILGNAQQMILNINIENNNYYHSHHYQSNNQSISVQNTTNITINQFQAAVESASDEIKNNPEIPEESKRFIDTAKKLIKEGLTDASKEMLKDKFKTLGEKVINKTFEVARNPDSWKLLFDFILQQ